MPAAPPPIRWVLGAGASLLALAAAAWLAWSVAELLFLVFLAILIASILHHPVDLLARRMPRALATWITLLVLAGVIAATILLLLPLVLAQARGLLQRLPAAVERLARWWTAVAERRELSDLIGPAAAALQQRLLGAIAWLASRALSVGVSLVALVGLVLFLLILATFLAYQPSTYLGGLLRLVPGEREHVAREFLDRLATAIRRWMFGTLVAMVVVGSLTSLGLAALGIDAWAPLGLLAFLGEFVPYLGPLVAGAPAVAAGLTQSGWKGLLVFLLVLVVQQVESYLVHPLIMRRAVKLHPALLLVWQLLLATAFGFAAVLVATPLLACVRVSVDYFWVERRLRKQ